MAEARALDRSLARLLRFVGHGGCRLVEGEGAHRLSRPDGAETGIEPAAITAGLGRGLVLRRGDRLYATSEARAWLRRHIAAREEAFLEQHRSVASVEVGIGTARETVSVNLTSSPLSALARLKDRGGQAWLSPDALEAGERLARDFHYGALQPRVTQSYEPRVGEPSRPGPGGSAELRDSVVAARTRVASAVEAMGPDLAGVALDVCCFEKGLETVERERQWPPRSAKLMLRTALLQLHRHYNPPAPSPKRRSHAWGAEGFRP